MVKYGANFDDIVAAYKENTRTYDKERGRINRAIELYGKNPQTVVSLGDRWGRDIHIWLEQTELEQLVLVDASKGMLAESFRSDESNDHRVTRVHAEMTSLEFKPESVSMFWMSSVA